jgi:hypothetical protein
MYDFLWRYVYSIAGAKIEIWKQGIKFYDDFICVETDKFFGDELRSVRNSGAAYAKTSDRFPA